MADKTLDTKGLARPCRSSRPKRRSPSSEGGDLEVLATDPGSVPDFTAFCEPRATSSLEKASRAGIYRIRAPALGLASAGETGHGAQDPVSRAGAERHARCRRSVLGTMMFGGPRRNRGPAHHRPCARERRQLHRHRRRLHPGALGGGHRPGHQGDARALGARDQARAVDRADVTDSGLSRRYMMQAVEASLKRLGTQPHRPLLHPPRRCQHGLGDTIATFGDLIRQGKIGECGALQRARLAHPPHRHLCRQLGVPTPVALQPY